MSKTTNEAVAARLAAQLEAGTSPFHQKTPFNLPVNPVTGKSYRGMTALLLGLQDRNDPRWMTLRQASNNKWKVEKGSKGTLINFLKTTDRVQLLEENGDKKLNSRGNPVNKLIKLEKPVETNAFVFNAGQVEGIPSLDEYLAGKAEENKMSAAERIADLIVESGAKITYVPDEEPFYDRELDEIMLPAKESYLDRGTPEAYAPAHIYELALWAGHESRMNLPHEDFDKESLRAGIATLLLSAEMGIPTFTDPQTRFENWAKIIKADPVVLEQAATDGQHIADYLSKFGQQREQKQAPINRQAERSLQVGDVIPYNNTEYEVTGRLKRKAMQVQEKESGNRFKIGPGDGIYNSLLQAKNNLAKQPLQNEQAEQEQDRSMEYEAEQELENETGLEQEQSNDLELVLNEDTGKGRSAGRKK
jgi:antirestriction protein ArdC